MKLGSLKTLYGFYIALSTLLALGLIVAALYRWLSPTTAAAWFMIYFSVTLVISIPFMLLWWRQIDEAAREAHKSAWFWGGSLAVIPAIGLAAGDLFSSGNVSSAILSYFHLAKAEFAAGVFITVAVMSYGYLGAWVFWWQKRK